MNKDLYFFRFLPDGIYLDACALGPEALAREMNDAIQNKQKYLNFFKWHKHYTFHNPIEKADTSGVCELCAMLNNEKRRNEKSIHTTFTTWWNISTVADKYNTCRISQ